MEADTKEDDDETVTVDVINTEVMEVRSCVCIRASETREEKETCLLLFTPYRSVGRHQTTQSHTHSVSLSLSHTHIHQLQVEPEVQYEEGGTDADLPDPDADVR